MGVLGISEARMERASRKLGALRTDTCLIKRPVTVTDAIGAPERALNTVSVLFCRVEESPGGVLRILGPVLAAVSSVAIVFERGADVRDQDIVEVARTGFRYTITGMSRGSTIALESVAGGSRAY